MASLSPYDLSKVVHLLLSVVDASELPPEPHERYRAIELARSWAPDQSTSSIEAIVDTAYVAARKGIDVEAFAHDVAEIIGHDGALRLLSNLGQIAQADGHLELREARMIGRIRSILHSHDTPPEAPPTKKPLAHPPPLSGKDVKWLRRLPRFGLGSAGLGA